MIIEWRMKWFWLMGQRSFLAVLFVINLLGTFYGFYWYKNQLNWTEPKYLNIFVPDSPTASAFFCLVLLCYLFYRRSPLLEAFASITLFKYGIWAVIMIVWGGWLDSRPFFESLTWQHWMLIGSHLAMALQALLYAPYYTYRWREIMIVGGWMLLNDALDYLLDIHPWLAPSLEPFDHIVGYFTLLLSLSTLLLFAIFSMLPCPYRRWEYQTWFWAGK
ncbi:DUF1405 domain-containing protein [Thermoactinomyces mirandus]|uniref:DUF1405 domain-containing protein n=1 Tax=Thermoactinomyces mirandus TaxID=2756294 RepID=UPI001C68CECE|nr:DUF1405 domain-containing protein [Thermoactinomyces mirandus]